MKNNRNHLKVGIAGLVVAALISLWVMSFLPGSQQARHWCLPIAALALACLDFMKKRRVGFASVVWLWFGILASANIIHIYHFGSGKIVASTAFMTTIWIGVAVITACAILGIIRFAIREHREMPRRPDNDDGQGDYYPPRAA